jgi:hypothetical protein
MKRIALLAPLALALVAPVMASAALAQGGPPPGEDGGFGPPPGGGMPGGGMPPGGMNGGPGGQRPPMDPAALKLVECINTKATADDKALLAKWQAVEIAASGPAAGIVTVDAAKKTDVEKNVAAAFTRLLVSDCAEEAKPLMAQGPAGFRPAGMAISRLAMRELMATPGLAMAMARSYLSHMNPADFGKSGK